jgi:hypothetical protein
MNIKKIISNFKNTNIFTSFKKRETILEIGSLADVKAKNIYEVDWYDISNKSMTEEFAEENEDKLYWDLVSKNENLTLEFIIKFENTP